MRDVNYVTSPISSNIQYKVSKRKTFGGAEYDVEVVVMDSEGKEMELPNGKEIVKYTNENGQELVPRSKDELSLALAQMEARL